MVIKIETVVLNWAERRHAGFLHRLNIGAATLDQIQHSRAGFLQDGCDSFQHRFHFRFLSDIDPDRVSGPAVGLNGGKVIGPFFLMIFGVLLRAGETVLFVDPGDDTNRAFGF